MRVLKKFIQYLRTCHVKRVQSFRANLNGCEIEVLDNTEKTEEQELVEDLIQIVTVFSCKLQGKRANKTRKLVDELINL